MIRGKLSNFIGWLGGLSPAAITAIYLFGSLSWLLKLRGDSRRAALSRRVP